MKALNLKLVVVISVCCCIGCLRLLSEKDVAQESKVVEVSRNSSNTCEWINGISSIFAVKVPKGKKNLENVKCLIKMKKLENLSLTKKIKIESAIEYISMRIMYRIEDFTYKIREAGRNKKKEKYVKSTLELLMIKIKKLEGLLEKAKNKSKKINRKITQLKIQLNWMIWSR